MMFSMTKILCGFLTRRAAVCVAVERTKKSRRMAKLRKILGSDPLHVP